MYQPDVCVLTDDGVDICPLWFNCESQQRKDVMFKDDNHLMVRMQGLTQTKYIVGLDIKPRWFKIMVGYEIADCAS